MPGTTTYYSIKYPLAGENIARQQLQDGATTTDTALHQAVSDAQAAGAAGASPYAANAAASATAASSSAALAAAAPSYFALLLGGA